MNFEWKVSLWIIFCKFCKVCKAFFATFVFHFFANCSSDNFFANSCSRQVGRKGGPGGPSGEGGESGQGGQGSPTGQGGQPRKYAFRKYEVYMV